MPGEGRSRVCSRRAIAVACMWKKGRGLISPEIPADSDLRGDHLSVTPDTERCDTAKLERPGAPNPGCRRLPRRRAAEFQLRRELPDRTVVVLSTEGSCAIEIALHIQRQSAYIRKFRIVAEIGWGGEGPIVALPGQLKDVFIIVFTTIGSISRLQLWPGEANHQKESLP